MKKLLLIFVMFLSSILSNAQDVIVKRDGSTVICKVIEVGINEVKYKKHSNLNGPLYSVSVTDIQNINYENGEKESFNDISSSSASKASSEKEVVLEYGRAIPIEIENTVCARDVDKGQSIVFRTKADIVVDGVTIIPLDTRVNGIVYEAKRSSWWGTKGKLGIRIDNLILADGTYVPLNGDVYVTGKNRTALTVILFLFAAWPTCFICGTKAELQAGYDTFARLGANVRYNKETKKTIIEPVSEEFAKAYADSANIRSSNKKEEQKEATDNGQSIIDKIDGYSGYAVMVLYKKNKERKVFITGTDKETNTVIYYFLDKNDEPFGNKVYKKAKKIKNIKIIKEE